MRTAGFFVFALLTLGVLANHSTAQPEGWHGSLKDGVEAAAKSNKPILLITAWKRTL